MARFGVGVESHFPAFGHGHGHGHVYGGPEFREHLAGARGPPHNPRLVEHPVSDLASPAQGLLLERAAFAYNDLWVLRETDLHVPRGGGLLVTGHNGVGKSTFLFLCAGLVPATTGRVLSGWTRAARLHTE